MSIVRRTRQSHYITAEVEFDIGDWLSDVTDEELHDLDLHRDSNCAMEPADASQLYAAINALHQQAHPDQPVFADTCLREPCRFLSLRQHSHLSSAGQEEL